MTRHIFLFALCLSALFSLSSCSDDEVENYDFPDYSYLLGKTVNEVVAAMNATPEYFLESYYVPHLEFRYPGDGVNRLDVYYAFSRDDWDTATDNVYTYPYAVMLEVELFDIYTYGSYNNVYNILLERYGKPKVIDNGEIYERFETPDMYVFLQPNKPIKYVLKKEWQEMENRLQIGSGDESGEQISVFGISSFLYKTKDEIRKSFNVSPQDFSDNLYYTFNSGKIRSLEFDFYFDSYIDVNTNQNIKYPYAVKIVEQTSWPYESLYEEAVKLYGQPKEENGVTVFETPETIIELDVGGQLTFIARKEWQEMENGLRYDSVVTFRKVSQIKSGSRYIFVADNKYLGLTCNDGFIHCKDIQAGEEIKTLYKNSYKFEYNGDSWFIFDYQGLYVCGYNSDRLYLESEPPVNNAGNIFGVIWKIDPNPDGTFTIFNITNKSWIQYNHWELGFAPLKEDIGPLPALYEYIPD